MDCWKKTSGKVLLKLIIENVVKVVLETKCVTCVYNQVFNLSSVFYEQKFWLNVSSTGRNMFHSKHLGQVVGSHAGWLGLKSRRGRKFFDQYFGIWMSGGRGSIKLREGCVVAVVWPSTSVGITRWFRRTMLCLDVR